MSTTAAPPVQQPADTVTDCWTASRTDQDAILELIRRLGYDPSSHISALSLRGDSKGIHVELTRQASR